MTKEVKARAIDQGGASRPTREERAANSPASPATRRRRRGSLAGRPRPRRDLVRRRLRRDRPRLRPRPRQLMNFVVLGRDKAGRRGPRPPPRRSSVLRRGPSGEDRLCRAAARAGPDGRQHLRLRRARPGRARFLSGRRSLFQSRHLRERRDLGEPLDGARARARLPRRRGGRRARGQSPAAKADDS